MKILQLLIASYKTIIALLSMFITDIIGLIKKGLNGIDDGKLETFNAVEFANSIYTDTASTVEKAVKTRQARTPRKHPTAK